MQKSLDKKTAVAVAARHADLKAKDTIDAYFCLRAFACFCIFSLFFYRANLNLHFHNAGLGE